MTLPPGFRFHPTDEELVDYYLKKRVKNIPIEFDVIADVDLYKCEPWDLPSKSKLPHGDNEWFFFSPRDRKYPNGSRTNRATEAGYWKATGRDRTIRQGTKTIGMKKTLVFYRGRAPHGERTDWLMHEYRLDGEEWENMNVPQDAYVLCRVFKKNGFGPPKNPSAGSGSMEEGDQVDSPGEVKSSTFADNDVKPSMSSLANLAPLSRPVSRQEVVSVQDHGPSGADNFETRPPMIFSDDPFVHSGSFRMMQFSDQDSEPFYLDEGLDKSRNDDESLEDFYKICPPLEGSNLPLGDEDLYNDIPGLTDPSKSSVLSELHKQWQEQVASINQAFGGQTFTKQEDFVSSLPENLFELPTLVQLPSPPTASQSVEENDTESSCVSSGNNSFTTIRLRTKPSSVSSSVVGNVYSPPYTAMRRVLYQQRGISFTSSPAPVSESSPTAEKQILNASQTEESNKSLHHCQAPAADTTSVDSGVANSQESSWATSVVCSPVPDVASDRRAVDDRSSPVPSPPVTLVLRKRVVDAPVLSKAIIEDLSHVHSVSLEASPSVLETNSRKSTTDEVSTKEVLDKEVCFEEFSGTSSVSHGSAEDVDQLTGRNLLKPSEASFDKVPESSNLTNEFLASDSSSMRIMGLRLLEPIWGLREFSAGHTASSKKKLTPRDMPSGIGSIHVNAVTVTCSCSAAGLPHVPTKACACYTTFWDGRCEKEKPSVKNSSEGQASETGHNPVPCFSGRCIILSILIPVLSAQFLLFPALSEYLSVERSSFRDSFLSFRDLLFCALGAGLVYLAQERPVPWRWIRRG